MQNIDMCENFIGSPLDRPLSPTDLVVSLMIAGPSLFIYKTLFHFFYGHTFLIHIERPDCVILSEVAQCNIYV